MELNHYLVIGPESSPLFTFYDDNIVLDSILIDASIDIIGQELSSDQFELEVIFNDEDEELRNLAWATPVWYYYNNVLLGKYYSTNVIRTGAQKYKIYATSAYGILGYKTHYGGIWSNAKFSDVVKNIIATDGIKKIESGYYTKLHRGNYGIINVSRYFQGRGYSVYGMNISSSGGDYETTGDHPLNYACKLEAKFTLNRCLIDTYEYYEQFTSTRVYLLGVSVGPSLISSRKWPNYGMYMNISRASVNDPWPDFGEVFFSYDGNTYSLGTPSGPTIYEISVDPSNSKATINGTDYSIPWTNTLSQTRYAPIGVFGGGNYIPGGVDGYHSGPLQCDALYEYCRIYDQNNDLISNFVTIKNYFDGMLYALDLCTATYSKNTDYGDYGKVNSSDYVPSADITLYPIMSDFPVVTADDFEQDLLNTIVYENGIENISVYGWIDICTKRDALHQLLFATGVILKKDASGNILFSYPTNTNVGSISEDRIFIDGSEEYPEHINSIEVTEHSYYSRSGTTETTIFDIENAPSTGAYYAAYKTKPIVGAPTATGVSLLEYNCNAAVLIGSGSLTGKPYVADSATTIRKLANFEDGKTITVTDATLVTLQNSASIADKLESYYGNAKRIKNSFLMDGESCGLQYALKNPFGENVEGFLAKVSQRPSSILKANAEFISDYTIPSESNVDYTNYVILTGNGTWDVPEEVFEKDTPRIRVVLIGGGQGGYSGYAGHDGAVTQKGGGSSAASGGKGGNPGHGGNVYDVVIDNPSASYSYSCGIGGEGGAISQSAEQSNQGNNGTDTEFSDGTNDYSSASGFPLANGYRNFFSGSIYASQLKHNQWNTDISGTGIGQGGTGGYIEMPDGNSSYWYNGGGAIQVFSSGVFVGGIWGSPYNTSGGYATTGGMGGGAAAGENGKDGSEGTKSSAGNGGDGGNATAIPPKATTYSDSYYGYGGSGGYGGGGGGCSGTISIYHSASVGIGGKGGYGGKGGDGGDGCVLIYY